MIGYLRGKVLLVRQDSLILDVGGVGYSVCCPAPLLARAEGETELFVTTVVREDAITLFGFDTEEDQSIFEQLMSVNKVGARTALGALSVMTSAEIVNAVLTGDNAALARIPGVGRKITEQIILDLKDKLGDAPAGAGSGDKDTQLIARAVEALTGLGFTRSNAGKAVNDIMAAEGADDLSGLISKALKQLGKGKSTK